MAVLVDTSVWIRFLSNSPSYADLMESLLDQSKVIGHDLVYGELFIGDSGGRRVWLEEYKKLNRSTVVTHAEVVEFVHDRKLRGRGIGWIDAYLLASAIVDEVQIWTADLRLKLVADDIGVGFFAD